MKHLFTRLLSILLLFGESYLLAQTPGQIFDFSTGVNSASVLNPNNDNYITKNGLAFNSSTVDEISQFEQNDWVTVFHLMTEPNSDLQTGSTCGPTEIVDNPTTGQHAAYYRIHDPNSNFGDGDEQLVFRMRVANEPANAAYGYSFLLDTDEKIGSSDPNSKAGNPGFEIELLYGSGNSGGVSVYNVDGVSAPNQFTTLASYPNFERHQRSYALNANCTGNNDPVFMDFYVDFADMGITVNTPLRMAFASASSSNSALGGSASDIGGADDSQFPNDDAIFEAVVNASPTFSFANPPTPPNCFQSYATCEENGDSVRVYEFYSVTEKFESGTDGWTLNGTTTPATRHNGGPLLGDNYFLGRFAQGQTIQKTFQLNQKSHRITFDFYRLDSWDNENIQIYVGDGTTLLVNYPVVSNNTGFTHSGSSNGYIYTLEALNTSTANIPYTGAPSPSTWYDQVIRVYIDVPTGLTDLTLKIGSTVNQAATDESWGMDNFAIMCTQFDVPAGVNQIEYLAVGGGGGGMADGGGGGGGGEIRTGVLNTANISSLQVIPGRGGRGYAFGNYYPPRVGDVSVILSNGNELVKANGGGTGGGWANSFGGPGGTGGFGGVGYAGGTGGSGPGSCPTTATSAATGSNGNNGTTLNLACSAVTYGGGGAGGSAIDVNNGTPTLGATGGQGGGGAGANYRLNEDGITSITGFTQGFDGVDGFGGGGGGGAACDGGTANEINQRTMGGDGGFGRIVIKYVEPASNNTKNYTVSNDTTSCAGKPIELAVTPTASGIVNQSGASFDGSNDYFSAAAPANLASGSEMTLEAWIKPNITSTGTGLTFLGMQGATSPSQHFQFRLVNNNHLEYLIRNSSNVVEAITQPTSISANEWTHVALVKNSSTYQLYINGQLVNSQTFSGAITASLSELIIGAYAEGNSPKALFFNGEIDEVRLWSVARTYDEIKCNMYRSIANASNLEASFSFSEGSGNTSMNTSTGVIGTFYNGGTFSTHTLEHTTQSYVWSTGETCPSITVSPYANTNYTVTVTEGNNTFIDSISVTTSTSGNCIPFQLTDDTTICAFEQVQISVLGDTSNNYALEFDGIDDYIAIADDMPIPSQDFTIEAWIKPDSLAGNQNILREEWTMAFMLNGTKFRSHFSDGTNWNGDGGIDSNADLEIGKWTHVAVTRTDGTVKLYINGVLDKEVTGLSSFNVANSSHPFRIGTNGVDSEYFDGQIDEVRIWSMARTAEEIACNMNKRINAATGLEASFSFSEGNGPTTKDAVTNASAALGSPTFTIDAPYVHNLSYAWSTGDSCSQITPLITNNTSIFVTVTDGPLSFVDTIDVSVIIPSFAFAQDTISVCGQDSFTVDAGAGWASYAWSNSATTQTTSVKTSGTYTVTVTDANGCTASDNVMVSVINGQIVQNDTNLCLGSSLNLSIKNAVSNNAADFTNGDFLRVANLNNFTNSNNITIGTWVKTTGSGVMAIASQSRSPSDANTQFRLLVVNGKLSFWDHNSGVGIHQVTGKGTVNDGQWHHIAFVKNNTVGKFYIDGSLDSTVTLYTKTYGSNDFVIGKEYRDNQYRFVGQMDDFQYWQASLTDAEVQAVYNRTPTQTSSLLLNYKFDNDNSSTIADATSNNNDAVNNSIGFISNSTNSYLWSTASTAPAINVTPTGNTTYYVTTTNGISSCVDSVTVTVSNPTFSFAQDTILSCGASSVTVDAGAGWASYAWSNSATTQTTSVSTSGTYTVTVTDANGCTATDNVVVSVIGYTITPDTTVCASSSFDLKITGAKNNENALFFDGIDDYVSNAGSPGLAFGTSPFTVEAWINCSSLPTTNTHAGIVGTYTTANSAANDAWFLSLLNLGGTMTLRLQRHGDANIYAYSDWTPSLNSWYHIAARRDSNGVIQLFIDGVEQSVISTNNWNSANFTRSGPIGVGFIATPFYFNGSIDEVRIWSEARTVEEIACGMNQRITSSANLEASLSFSEGSGLTTQNSVTSNNFSINGPVFTSNTPVVHNQSYIWSTGDTCKTVSVSPSSNTKYYVTVSDGISSCVDSVSVTVSNPSFAFAQDTITSCGASSVTIDAGAGWTSYAWSNAATTQTTSVSSSGTYSVTVTDANGCTASDDVLVALSPPIVASFAPSAPSGLTAVPSAILNNVPEATGYGVVYELDIPIAANYANNAINYAINNSNVTNTNHDRVAYYMQLDGNWIWVSMDDFASGNLQSLGLPRGQTNNIIWDRVVNNMNVYSNKTGITTGNNIATGNIEMWSQCYGTNANSGIGGSSSVYDFDDEYSGGPNCHGSFQVHNHGANQTLFAYNRFPQNSTGELGIGNNSGSHPDWTFQQTANTYTTRKLYILVGNTNASFTTLDCNGDTDGSVSLTATGGTQPFTYLWSNSDTTANLTGLSAGIYTVTITDANSCTNTSSVTITEPAALAASSVVNANVSCNGLSDASATAGATGGTSPYTFAWSNSATTASITGLSAGSYTVTVTDANSCTTTSSVTITEPAILTASASNTPLSCNGGSNGTATANGTGGTAPYTFAWSNAATTATSSGLVAGTYTVTVTDANNCTTTSSTTITEPTVLVASSVVDSNATCNGFSNGGATASATGGTSPYNYVWSNAATTASITGLSAGTYTVTVTDANNCTITSTAIITEPSVLTASTVVDSTINCFGTTSGGATANATGGTSPYTYLWSNSSTSASISGVSEGIYTVTVTDVNGCTNTSTANIIKQSLNYSCSLPIALTNWKVEGQTSNGSWTRFNSDLSVRQGTNSDPTFFVSDSVYFNTAVEGEFGVMTTGDDDMIGFVMGYNSPNSLSSVNQYDFILFDWKQTAQTASTNGTAPQGARLLKVNGTSSSIGNVFWNASDPIVTTLATNTSIGGWADNTYYQFRAVYSATNIKIYIDNVLIFDVNGAFLPGRFGFYNYSQSDAVYRNFKVPFEAVVNTTAVTCNGLSDGTATVSSTSGTYQTIKWSTGDTSQTISNLAPGNYSVTITNSACCADSVSFVITEPVMLSTSAVINANVSCNGGSDGSATASVTGGTAPYTFVWSNSATTASITGVAAGTYTVTVSDANSCTTTSSVTITEPAVLTASSVVNTNISCNGGSDGSATASAISGTSPYAFAWSNAATSATASGLVAGTYTVTVTDANNCTTTSSTTITEPTAVVASSVVNTNISCNGGNNGSAKASAIGGTAPYTFAWSNSATTASITGVTAGTYTVTVSDANSCTNTSSVTITEPAVLTASSVVNTNISCNGGNNGSATASGSGGTSPYTFAWSNAATTASITGVTAGTYIVTVSDANSCTATSSVTITEPAVLAASTVANTNVSCNGGSNGSATASGSGGTSPYTFAWSNSSTTASITGLSAGSYTVTVSDANSCTATSSVTITEPAILVASTVTNTNVSCNGGNNGSATASGSGGTAPYTFVWSNSVTTATASGLVAGTYTVTVTDANNCTITSSTTITEPTAVLAASTVANTNVSCNGGNNGSATASGSGGTAPYTFVWSNAATTASITGLSAGSYTVTVSDANSCTSTSSVTITEPAVLAASTVTNTNVSCNGGNNGSATASGSGGTAPYTFVWSNAATTASIIGITAGTYTVTVSDANSCTTTSSVTIIEPAVLAASTVANANVTCNGLSNGSATASGSGGTAPYSFVWSNAATTASITGLSAGSYTVTASDANSCTTASSVIITEPALLVASASTTQNVTIFGSNDGSASVNVTGGTPVYNYSWSNGGTGTTITSLSSGTYTVTITDANACTSISQTTVNEPGSIILSMRLDSNVTCSGGMNGGAGVSVTGGVKPYTLLWSNGKTDSTLIGLSAGTYTVTVTDANGGTAVNDTTVTEPAQLSVAASIVNNASCGGVNDGAAQVSVTGGTLPYSIIWSNSATTTAINNLLAGTYSVTITDANNCSAVSSVTVLNIDTVKPSLQLFSSVTVYLDSLGSATLNVNDVDSASFDNCGIQSITLSDTLFGCTLPSATYNGVTSLNFDGVDDYVSIPNSITQDSNHTISVWVKSTASNSPNIFGWGGSGVNNYGGLSFFGSRLRYYSGNGTPGVLSVNGNSIVADGSWHHVAVTRDGSGTVLIYVDGQLDASGSISKYVNAVSNVSLGSFFANGIYQGHYNGSLDDFNYWSRVLSASDIQGLICKGSKGSGLKVSYDFSDGIGSSISANNGSSSVNGTLVNMDINASWVSFGTPVVTNCTAENATTITIVDASGNRDSVNVKVAVIDSIKPIISTQPLTVYLDANGQATITATDLDNGTSDNCQLASIAIDSANFDCSEVGANTVVFTAIDVNGNTSISTETVTVIDSIKPIILTQPLTVYLDANGLATITANDLNNGTTDNCQVASIAIDSATFDHTELGPNNVWFTAIDVNNNVDSMIVIVTVLDTTVPVIAAQPRTIYLDVNGQATIAAADLDNGTTDNSTVVSISIDSSNFDCSEVGVNTVNFKAIDASGNRDSVNVLVTVIDSLKPLISTQPITVYLGTSGLATIAATDLDNGTSDNCQLASIAIDSTTFDYTELGPNNVWFTAVDVNSNVDSMIVVVTVLDTTRPVVATQPRTIYLDASGQATITASDLDNGTADNGTLFTIAIDSSNFDCSEVGVNTVNFKAIDASGNRDSVNVLVTVIDSLKPLIVTQPITVYLGTNGLATITANDLDNGTSGNCQVASISIDSTTFDVTELGPNNVWFTAIDVNANRDSVIEVVTVLDTIAPMVSNCPSNISVTTALNSCDAVVTWTAPTGSDNGQLDSLIGSHVIGSTFPLGTTTITYIAYDQSMNTDTCSFTITVLDSVAPIIANVPSTITVNNDAGQCGAVVSWTLPTATDNCQLDSLVSSHSVGTLFTVGTTTVTYIAYDAAMNTDTISFTVTVNDTEKPTIVCIADTTICDGVFTYAVPTTTDNCGVASVVRTAGLASGSTFPVGSTLITYLVTDIHGNVDSCSFTVTRDEQPTQASAGADYNVCSDTVILTGNNPIIGIGIWSSITSGTAILSPSDSASRAVLQRGVNTLVWTISNGACASSSDTITITYDSEPSLARAGSDQTLCDERSTTMEANVPQTGTGVWSFIGGTGIPSNVNDARTFVSGLGNGENVLVWTISNGACGTSSDTVRLIGADIPIVDAGQDTTIFEDNGYQLSVSTDIPVSDYRWDPVFSLDNAAIQRPFARPAETTTYTVKVTTDLGCEAQDDVTLTVIKDLVIPSAFTPNGDGANDTWEIKNLDQYESHSVVVYDGYGSEVLRTTTYENWDGKYKGNMLSVGSYYYVIELKLGSNNTYKSGAISILR